jgi:CelD/BcsL family acetyltransferase involved in cellulose biosynthesis
MRSAGAGLHLANMKYLLERGVVHYDHLAGFNQYKQDYAKMRRNLAGLTIAKPTIRAAIQDAVSYSRRAARKIASLIGNSGKRPAATTPAPAEPVGEAEDN